METKDILFKDHSNKFDTRKTLNRANDIVIDAKIVEQIENEGLTSEILDEMKVPIFKYQTQVTLHGVFNNLNTNYIGGYKNLFLNGNKTLGVKYNAIDFGKKKQIAQIVGRYKWYFNRNSVGDCFIQSFNSKEKDEALALYKSIDVSKYYASKYIYALNCWGLMTYYVEVVLRAIYENEVFDFCSAMLNKSVDDINVDLIAFEKEDEIKKQEYEVKQLAEKEESDKKEAEAHHIIDTVFIPQLVELNDFDGKFIPGMILVKAKLDYYTPKFHFIFLSKVGGGYYNRKSAYSLTLTAPEIPSYHKGTSDRDANVLVNKLQGYKVFSTPNVNEPNINKNDLSVVQNIKQIDTKIVTTGVSIVDYSDKAIAVIGNTKPIKDTLKNMGGRFNMYLTCGPGWIFPKTKRAELAKFI